MRLGNKPLWFLLAGFFLYGCSSQSGRRQGQSPETSQNQPATEQNDPELEPAARQNASGTGKASGQTASGTPSAAPSVTSREASAAPLQKVTFYLENSESMFGYVSGITNYVDVVSELAEKPDFVKEDIVREFFFINGTGPVLTPIGDDPLVLKKKLNTTGFRCGDITRSNLNGMFQTALGNAGGGTISILISDGIYDIGDGGMTSLVTSGKETRSRFIKRLQSGDMQTILIKLTSEFRGNYFYASRKGKVNLNSVRPYYIWIFGESHLLGKYFPDSYISGELTGYETLARFLKPGSGNLPWQVVPDNSIGTYRFDHKVKNRLIDAKPDRNGRGFQLTLAVDFSPLPFPDSYYLETGNYVTPGNYEVSGIQKPAKKIHALSFTPTHLVSVKTMKNPAGKLTVSLASRVPAWIGETAADDEEAITTDTSRTFGFKYLTDAIVDAYRSMSEEKHLATFTVEIQ